ncbi:MAG: DUF2800 domain-containing protein [Steroidobacteraceae bacterium]
MSDLVVTLRPGEHSELGPSSGERTINCPGSVLASRGVYAPPSKYALSGTAAHSVSEWVRTTGLPAAKYIGTTVRIPEGGAYHDVKVNKAMAISVQQFCDRVAQVPGYELIEARVSYDDMLYGPPELRTAEEIPAFGTSDSIKLNDNVCYVGDFKDGEGVKKDAAMNEQLLLYSIGTWLGWKWAYSFDTFVLDIYQPRRNHFDRSEIKLAELLQWFGDVAKPAMLRSLKPGAPFKAGPWCQFCKVKDTCAVRNEYRQERDGVSRKNDFALIGL